jgi:hypothetical protein
MQVNNLVQVQSFFVELFRPIFEEVISESINKINEVKNAQPPADTSERYLTKKQVCELLQISYVCLHNYEKRGLLSRIEFGGIPRYRLSDIEKSIQSIKTPKK